MVIHQQQQQQQHQQHYDHEHDRDHVTTHMYRLRRCWSKKPNCGKLNAINHPQTHDFDGKPSPVMVVVYGSQGLPTSIPTVPGVS